MYHVSKTQLKWILLQSIYLAGLRYYKWILVPFTMFSTYLFTDIDE